MVYPCNGILLSNKKKEIFLQASVGDRKNKKKSRPQQGPQNKFVIIDKLDAIRHETLGTSPEGTVHHLENKI